MRKYPDWFLKAPYRPEPQNNGEADRNNLHLGVGLICHNWEHLEGRLYDLYVALFCLAHPSGVNYGAYQASYSAIISPKARHEMVTSMLTTSFHPKSCAYKEISPLLKLIGRAVGRRNEAAHGLVVSYNSLGLFVMPPRYAPLPTWEMGAGSAFKYRYNADRLSAIAQVISDLERDLNNAILALEQGVIGPFPERLQPPISLTETHTVPLNAQQGPATQR
jgi:hypothetical protein